MIMFKSQIFIAGWFRHVFLVPSVHIFFCNAGVLTQPNISYLNTLKAVPGGHEVKDVGLQPLYSWDRGFDSR